MVENIIKGTVCFSPVWVRVVGNIIKRTICVSPVINRG